MFSALKVMTPRDSRRCSRTSSALSAAIVRRSGAQAWTGRERTCRQQEVDDVLADGLEHAGAGLRAATARSRCSEQWRHGGDGDDLPNECIGAQLIHVDG